MDDAGDFHGKRLGNFGEFDLPELIDLGGFDDEMFFNLTLLHLLFLSESFGLNEQVALNIA